MILRTFVIVTLGYFISLQAVASNVPDGLTLQGRIVKPNDQPLEAVSVAMNVRILSPTNDCILLEENHTVPMTGTNGIFSIILGSGTRTGADKAYSLLQVFKNPSSYTGLSCGTGTAYSALSGHSRKVRLSFNDGIETVTLTSDFVVRSVPYSTIAETVQGKSPADFIQVNSTGTLVLTQNKAEQLFENTIFTELIKIIDGTTTQYAKKTELPVAAGSLNMSAVGKDILVRDVPTSGDSAVNKDYVLTTIAATAPAAHTHAAADIVSGVLASARIPTGTDDTKLPLLGGTMTGHLNMGAKNILATGHITMSAGTTINLGTYDDNAEDLLDDGFTGADKGKFWYNTDSDNLKFWDGSAVVAVGAGGGGGITSFNTATGAAQVLQLGTAGNSPAISRSGDTHTIDIPVATATATGVMNTGAGLVATAGEITPDFGTGAGKVVQGNDDRLAPAPVIGTALSYIRQNAGGTLYEARTPAQMVSDLGLGTAATAASTSFLAAVVAGTAGNVLTSDGTNWTSAALPVATGAAKGIMQVGTGFAVTTGTVSADFGSGVGKITEGNDVRLPPAPIVADALKYVRVNVGGTAYESASIVGGTALSGGTSGGIPYYSGAATMASSAALTQHAVILGGGAGAAPVTMASLGTATHVLTSNGAGLAPTWQAPSTAAADSLDFAHLEDTLDLDANLVLNQTTNTWTQNFTGTTGAGMLYSADSLTSGVGALFSSSSTAGTGSGTSKVLSILRSGTNANASHTAYGFTSMVANTGTTSTNVAGYFSATGATNNYGMIVENGNVGIGTTAPAMLLDVRSSTAGTAGMWGAANSNASHYLTLFSGHTGVVDPAFIYPVSRDLRFGTGAYDASTFTERVRITSGGNVGIGTSGPGTALDVAGAITSRPFGTTSGNTGQIILRELAATGSNTATIRAPDALGADYTLTLPADDGAPNQMLQTDGSGTLKWTHQVSTVGSVNLTAQGADVGPTTLLTPAANTMYRASCMVVLTRAATTSSQIPFCYIGFTDVDTNAANYIGVTGNNTNNTLGNYGVQGLAMFYAKAGVAVTYGTSGYASAGATTMQYSVRVRIEEMPP